jgi:hypothetical protein
MPGPGVDSFVVSRSRDTRERVESSLVNGREVFYGVTAGKDNTF